MDVRRHERKGHSSRSMRDASNKENICPLEARVIASEMMGSRRSPLPVGFPRSPLQDITHIICPTNIWRDGEDPFTGQVHKKFKRENSVGVCAENDNESSSSSWKGLKSCVQVRLQTKENEAEETAVAKVDIVPISPIPLENHSETSTFCIHRDEPASSAASAPMTSNSEGKGFERGRLVAQADSLGHLVDEREDAIMEGVHNDGESGEKCIEGRTTVAAQVQAFEHTENGKVVGKMMAQAHHLEHSKICRDRDMKHLGKNVDDTCMHMLVVKDENCKRPEKATQVKKRSTLSMLR